MFGYTIIAKDKLEAIINEAAAFKYAHSKLKEHVSSLTEELALVKKAYEERTGHYDETLQKYIDVKAKLADSHLDHDSLAQQLDAAERKIEDMAYEFKVKGGLVTPKSTKKTKVPSAKPKRQRAR